MVRGPGPVAPMVPETVRAVNRPRGMLTVGPPVAVGQHHVAEVLEKGPATWGIGAPDGFATGERPTGLVRPLFFSSPLNGTGTLVEPVCEACPR